MWTRLDDDYSRKKGPRRAGPWAKLCHLAAVQMCHAAQQRWVRGGRRGWVPAAEFDAVEVASHWGWDPRQDTVVASLAEGLQALVREGVLVPEGDAGWWIADWSDFARDPTTVERSAKYRAKAKTPARGPRHGRHSDARDGTDGGEGQQHTDAGTGEPEQPRVTDSHGRHSDARDGGSQNGVDGSVGGAVTVTPVTSRHSTRLDEVQSSTGGEFEPASQRAGVRTQPPPESHHPAESTAAPPPRPASARATPQPAERNGERNGGGGKGRPAAQRPWVERSSTSADLEAQVASTTRSLRGFKNEVDERAVLELLLELDVVRISAKYLAPKAAELLERAPFRRNTAWLRTAHDIAARWRAGADRPSDAERRVEERQEVVGRLRAVEARKLGPLSESAWALCGHLQIDLGPEEWSQRARDVLEAAGRVAPAESAPVGVAV